MQVFKCALHIVRAHIVFPLVYIVGLSFMGIFMAISFDFGQPSEEFQLDKAEYAIVDRDGGPIAQGIAEALKPVGERIDIEDSRLAFQDAVAKGTVDYLLVIPDGYSEAFRDAVESNKELPKAESIFSYYIMEGVFVDEAVNAYLGNLRTLMLAKPDASMSAIVEDALDVTSQHAKTMIVPTESLKSEADRFVFYLQWSTYTLFAGITVCIGVLTATMNRADLRRRNLVSPMPFLSYNLQLALACIVITLAAWAWSFVLGMIAFPEAIAQISALGMVWCALSLLVLCLIPLSLGFLIGQLGASMIVANAIGNIVGMVVSFFGGAWIPIDLMSPEILTIAHWLPGLWYINSCSLSAHLGASPDMQALIPILECFGVMLLFAAAIFAVALVMGRMRTQTSDAGGNAAAEVPTL